MLVHKILVCLCVRIFFSLDYFSLYHQKNSYFYEILFRNNFTDQRNKLEPLELFFYYLVPEIFVSIFIAIIDAVISYYIKDTRYFIFSSFLISPISSVENLIILVYLVTKEIDAILLINPYFICLQEGTFYNAMSKYYLINEQLTKFAENRYLPNTNNFWFYYMYIFDQYKPFFTNLINTSCILLSALARNDVIGKILILLLFKKSTYKNYLLLYCLCKKRTKKRQTL